MHLRGYKRFVLCVALLIFGQAVLPSTAMASVSMRCVGMAADTPACARAVLPAAEAAAGDGPFATMPCCREMHAQAGIGRCLMGMAQAPTAATRPAARAAALSAPGCLLSIRPLTPERTVLAVRSRAWLLAAAPSLAPPAALPAPACPAAIILLRRPVRSLILPATDCRHAHGLRAPPAA